MFKNYHAPLRVRFRFPHLDYLGLGGDRIADEDRFGKFGLLETQIAYCRSERQLADRKANHQPQCEDAVDQTLAELRVLREFGIEMKRLRVHRQRREQQIIGFRNCAAGLMAEHIADAKFLKIFSRHNILLENLGEISKRIPASM